MPVQASPFLANLKELGVDLTAVDSTAKHVLGSRAFDQSGNEYQYVFADTEAITVLALVQVDIAGVVTLSNATSDRIDGFATTAIALDKYGWIGVRGDFASVPVHTDIALNDPFSVRALTAAKASGLPATYAAASSATRGICLTTPASGTATCRFF